MPVNDWEDSWYDEPLPKSRSRRAKGGVTAVAIVTFITCAFNAASSTCLLFCGVFLAAIEQANNNKLQMPANILAWIALGIGIGNAVSFLAQIVVGIGLLNLRRWARIASFYLAAYSAALSGFLVYLMVTEDSAPEALLVICGVGLLFHGVYAVATISVLLNAQVARSFQ